MADAPHWIVGQKMLPSKIKINDRSVLICSGVALKKELDLSIYLGFKRHDGKRRDGYVYAGGAAVEGDFFGHHGTGVAYVGATE